MNETCKDALNIMDFVNQLQVGINDLEKWNDRVDIAHYHLVFITMRIKYNTFLFIDGYK
jgi:hypothetical protein